MISGSRDLPQSTVAKAQHKQCLCRRIPLGTWQPEEEQRRCDVERSEPFVILVNVGRGSQCTAKSGDMKWCDRGSGSCATWTAGSRSRQVRRRAGQGCRCRVCMRWAFCAQAMGTTGSIGGPSQGRGVWCCVFCTMNMGWQRWPSVGGACACGVTTA